MSSTHMKPPSFDPSEYTFTIPEPWQPPPPSSRGQLSSFMVPSEQVVDVSRMHIRGCAVHVGQSAPWESADYVRLRVVLDVADVVTGQDNHVTLDKTLHRAILKDGKVPAQIIRSAILQALVHELDECLLVDGKRVVEPHPEQPTGAVFRPTEEKTAP